MVAYGCSFGVRDDARNTIDRPHKADFLGIPTVLFLLLSAALESI